MKNFIAELLIKLAEKEEESKELSIQVQAHSMILTALLQSLDEKKRHQLIENIESSLSSLPREISKTQDVYSNLDNVVKSLLTPHLYD